MLKFNPQLVKRIPVDIKRYDAGSYVDGDWVLPAPYTLYDFEVILHPAKDKERLVLKEADRTKELICVYSELEMRIAEEGEYGADIIIWEGRPYRATRLYKATLGSLDHYKIIAVRVKSL